MESQNKRIWIPDSDDRVMLEYIFVGANSIVSKTYVVKDEPNTVEECPTRSSNEFENNEESGPCPELALRPVAMYRDPFRQGKHKIVLCTLDYFSDQILANDTRFTCKQLLDKITDEEPWFGLEQTYFFVDDNDMPFDWDLVQNNPSLETTLEYYIGEQAGFQRELTEIHMKACLYAGLEMYGMNREFSPSQWEYQIGPLPGISAPDQLIVSRFILMKLAEMHGLKVTLRNHKWMLGTMARSALHINFSTKKMRADGGLRYIKAALENIAHYNQEDILKFYDLEAIESKTNYKWRLNGIPFMPKWDNLVCKVGDKYDSSLRIPAQVALDSKGYFEDRRPSGEADPYDVCRVLTAAALLQKYEF